MYVHDLANLLLVADNIILNMSHPVNQKLSVLFLPTLNMLVKGLESIVFEQGQRMQKMPVPSVLTFKNVVIVGSLDTL